MKDLMSPYDLIAQVDASNLETQTVSAEIRGKNAVLHTRATPNVSIKTIREQTVPGGLS